jgi:hypothetical protein
MSNHAIAPLDPVAAERILQRVPYGSRFPIGCLVPPVGLLQSSVRSLGELELAMRPEDRSLVGVNLDRLTEWIERAIGDPTCASAVRDVAATAGSYAEACEAVQRVIAARVASARLVLESTRHGQAGEPTPRREA